MYKHSTTHRTLSRRLAALLAALALLAAMALPVYADASDGATQKPETFETDNNVETGSDVETDDKSGANEGTGTGADTDSNDTNDNASPNPGANSTTQADNAAADKTAPCEEKTDLTEEDTADGGEGPADEAGAKETFFAADTYSEDETESDDRSAPMTASNEGGTASFIPNTVTVYFVVDNNKYHENYRIKFYAQRTKDGSDRDLNRYMLDTGETIDGRKIFKVTLSQTDYPEGGFYRLIFQYYEGDTHKGEIFAFGGHDYNDNSYKWTTIDQIAGKRFDGTSQDNVNNAYNDSQWTRVEYYYAGMPLYFKNASNTALTNVTATFYKLKDGTTTTEETGSQPIGTVDAGKLAAQQIRIPDNDSRFVQFSWNNGQGQSALYDFTTDYTEGSTPAAQKLDLTTANCYVYNNGNGTADSWASAGADLLTAGKMIYFDSTFSSYAYAGENTPQNAMPKTDDNGNAKMYCFLQKADGSFDTVEMTSATDPNALGRQLWSYKIPNDEKTYTAVQFSATNDKNAAAKDDKTKVYSTANIPPTLQEPCFFADNGDPTAYTYTNDAVYREGYWGEKSAVRDAESGKGTTVVDIDNTTPFVRNSATKYVTTTLYDYYTDWELNGNNRDKYNVANGMSQRNWVTFRQFDQALSDYYIAYNNANKEGKSVAYPIYTGHFQPEAKDENGNTWGCPFKDVANSLNLYGYNESDKNKFMAVNNSTIDVDGVGLNNGETRYYDDAFQGLTGDELVNGEPVLYNTKLTVPYFNKDFLEGANSKKAVLGKVYENVDFPFTKEDVFGNGINYWHYESNDKSLFLKQKEGTADQYFLQQPAETVVNGKMVSNNAQNVNSSSGPLGTYGFFPFNEGSGNTHANTYNYGFGAKLQFDFTLTDDGKVLDNKGNKVPIQFFFSGDDDVWVYIDNNLALDVGGDHGKVSGLLEFGLNGGKLVYTPYVSDVKASNRDRMYKKETNVKSVNYRVADNQYKSIPFNYKGDQKEISAGKHTLKFFYMERGMWESNMAIAFNFPDNNELEVEKKVDVDDVNNSFKSFFDNVDSFGFTIKNLATHYGEKSASTLEETKTLDVTQNTWNAQLATSAGKNVCAWEKPTLGGTSTEAIHWYADMKDEGSTNREKRYGEITLNSGQAKISEMSYLSFEVYADTSDDTYLNLNDLYLELVDSSNRRKGSLGTSGLAGKTYNSVSKLKANDWVTIKLDLSKLTVDQDFDPANLKTIRIGDNCPVDLYIRNIQFTSKAAASALVGFTTAQKDIPDYGTAIGNTNNEMKPAEGAQYTSSLGGSTQVVDKDGSFQLKNKETVTFKDQFRRGSYISVTEDADPDLYETIWTIYENGKAVTSNGGGNTVSGGTLPLSNVKSNAPDDGRVEKKTSDIPLADDTYGNSYSGAKPKGEAIVFRSYTNPDAGEAAELTKLKLQFVNKVKTGSIIIKKLGDSTVSSGTFKFKVTYTNVGGQNLEGNAKVEETYSVDFGENNAKTISGIPIGTQFTIEEVPDEDGKTHLLSVAVAEGDKAQVVDGKTVKGTVTKTDSPSVTATFTNTMHDLMDIDLVKSWKNADDSDMTEAELNEMPKIIYVKLQRRVKAEPANKWVDVEYPSGSTLGYVAVKRGYTGWKCQFANLDATAWNLPETPEYEYRVVEGTLVNNKFNPVDSNSMLVIGDNVYQVGSNTADKDNKTITLTNTLQDPKFKLDITKKDAENINNLLAGVGFTLEKMKDDGSGNLVVDSNFNTLTGVTNDNGELMVSQTKGFTNLEAGTYRLTETKAAKDYNLLSEPIIISFSKDGRCQVGNETQRHAEAGTIFTGDAATGYTLNLTVLNRKTPALPHTGADAPSLWLLIGLPLAVAGLLILVFRYNKKGGRTR